MAFAHALIDAGADLVFGHSSHVFRGIELYKGRPILYGTGNFVDDYAVDKIERNDQSFVYVLEIEDRIPKGLRLYPTQIRGCRAFHAKGTQRLLIVEKMKELCSALNTFANWNQLQECLEAAPLSNEGDKSGRIVQQR